MASSLADLGLRVGSRVDVFLERDSRMKTMVQFERRVAGAGVFGIVVSRLSHRQESSPVILFMVDLLLTFDGDFVIPQSYQESLVSATQSTQGRSKQGRSGHSGRFGTQGTSSIDYRCGHATYSGVRGGNLQCF